MAKRPVIDPNLFAKTEDKPESVQADKPESVQAYNHESVQAQNHESAQVDKHESTKARKRAATFYFDPSTLEALERAWLAARGRGESVTKSAIVEAALLAALGDPGGG